MWTSGCLLYMQTTISCKENGIEYSLAVESIKCNQWQSLIPPACFLLLFFSLLIGSKQDLDWKISQFSIHPTLTRFDRCTISTKANLNCWWSLKWLAKLDRLLKIRIQFGGSVLGSPSLTTIFLTIWKSSWISLTTHHGHGWIGLRGITSTTLKIT